MDIDNALVEVSGPEIPILDGSSRPFIEAIESVASLIDYTSLTPYAVKHKLVHSSPLSISCVQDVVVLIRAYIHAYDRLLLCLEPWL